MPKKRDYLHCFICQSDCLWSGKKQTFCLECKSAASLGSWCKYGKCPPTCCHHKGKKDYFSICYTCYRKVPLKDDLTKPIKETDPNKPFAPEQIIPGKYHKVVDWNWIIEKQKELEKNEFQKAN